MIILVILKRELCLKNCSSFKSFKSYKRLSRSINDLSQEILDYKEFSTLVASVASNHNALFKIKENKLSRKAYFYQYILVTDSKKSEDFNINMPASIILANATKRNTNDNASYFTHSEK